jgi:beta-glucosidase
VKESVLFFLSDRYASMTPSVKKLKDFQKVEIGPNSSKNVTFSVRRADLGFIGEDMKLTIEPGDFDVMIGDRKASFYYKNY